MEPLEITAELNGKQILFHVMAAGDVLDLLISVSAHLGRRIHHALGGDQNRMST